MPDGERDITKDVRLKALDYETCLACKKFQTDWSAMPDFQRRSNYAVAANYAHKAVLLKECGVEGGETRDFALLSQEDRDRLQEIEHIRWCRFHYLNNWVYGNTGNGKKDSIARIHPLLVPYGELSRLDKYKDGDSYRTFNVRNRASIN